MDIFWNRYYCIVILPSFQMQMLKWREFELHGQGTELPWEVRI